MTLGDSYVDEVMENPCLAARIDESTWNIVEAIEPVNRVIERAEEKLLMLPQIDCPLEHKFAPGVYLREIIMPKGAFIIGHEHKTEHFNIVLSGRARVLIGGDVQEIVAPCIFVSKPGVRKVLYILEEMRWATVHPTEETNVGRLEDELIAKSATYLRAEDVKKLKEESV